MKKGIFTWFGYVLPFDEKIRLIKEAGFEATCIWWGDEFSESDGKKELQLKKALAAGLEVDNVHLPYYGCNALWMDNEKGKECMDFYAASLLSALENGIERIVMHPFEVSIPPEGKMDIFISRLNELISLASERSGKICLENLGDNAGFRQIMALADDRLAFCFDSGHNNVCAKDDLSLLKEYSNKVLAVHLHDNNSQIDEHLLPGEGVIRWPLLMATLRDTVFEGAYMLESCQPYGYDEAEGYGAEVKVERTSEEYLEAAVKAAEKYFI